FDTCEKIPLTDRDNGSSNIRTAEYNDLMRIYPNNDEETADPYFKFRYYQTNIKDDDLDEKITSEKWKDGFRIIDSDYIMVALGSDDDNLSVTSNLGRYLKTVKMANKENKRTVVAYVIYDSDLCNALNMQKNSDINNVYMHAFGSINEVYNIDNVFMLETRKSEKEIFDSYQGVTKEVQQKLYESSYPYDYWSNIARALHIKYKVFSAGYINCSIFDNNDRATRQKKLDKALEDYKKNIIPYAVEKKDNAEEKEKIKQINDGISKENEEKVKAEIYLKLAWLEHRGWNAFSRVNGFRRPVGFKVYEETGNHKNLDLKLHSCLVETDYRTETYDCLDYLRDDLFSVQKKNNDKAEKKDFKKYDAPGYDFKCNNNGELE
ncbi:MAG: hypothetical protein LIO53_04880, partial [Oscillospiraceae bacterium]|nr:hypothetical protein [Oscillospiraceae bacterium]